MSRASSPRVPTGPPPTTLPEVLDQLRAVAEGSEDDPVQPFARMYLRMTEQVAESLDLGEFADGDFVGRLDVVFAEYFLGPYSGRTGPPKCWRVLFDAQPAQTHPLRYALAGMNAHINMDLALSVLDTCREFDTEPDDDSGVHRDYLVVNGVIAKAFDEVKEWFVTGPLAPVDRALGEADDALGLWGIERARDAAWTRAQMLHQVRSLPLLQRGYVSSHDSVVAMVGRALLALPTPSG